MATPEVWSLAAQLRDVLERLLPAIPQGGALLVGDNGESALLLAARGLRPIEVVVFSPADVVKCHKLVDDKGLPISVAHTDPATVTWPPQRYAVAVVTALERLPPRAGDRLLEQVRGAVESCGLVIAAAPTIEDAGYDQQGAASPTGDRRSSAPPNGGEVRRYFIPGELAMAFEGWALLHSVSESRAQANGERRAWSIVAARRPPCGTLLA